MKFHAQGLRHEGPLLPRQRLHDVAEARARVPVHGLLLPQPRRQPGAGRTYARGRGGADDLRDPAPARAVLRVPRRPEPGGVHPERHRFAEHRAVRPRRRGRPCRHHPGRAQLRAAPALPPGARPRGAGHAGRGRCRGLRGSRRDSRRARSPHPGGGRQPRLERPRIGPGSRRDRDDRTRSRSRLRRRHRPERGRHPHRHGCARDRRPVLHRPQGPARPHGDRGDGRRRGSGDSACQGRRYGHRLDFDVPARRLSAPPGGGNRLDTRHRGAERRAEVVRGTGPRPARRRPRRRPRRRVRVCALPHRVRGSRVMSVTFGTRWTPWTG